MCFPWIDIDLFTPLTLTKQPDAFTDPDWLFETKYDGFRCLAYIGEGTCKLVSRNGDTFTRFRRLASALSGLKRETILDGEIACVDKNRITQFNDLVFANAPEQLFAFDILVLDGEDLRERPCDERKQILRGVVRDDIPQTPLC